MEELIQLAVNNGLGIASFFALIYFYNKYVSEISTTNKTICDNLGKIEKSLTDLNERVYKLENKNNKF